MDNLPGEVSLLKGEIRLAALIDARARQGYSCQARM